MNHLENIIMMLIFHIYHFIVTCFLMQFFPTAEESIDYYNQKRCFDGKGLILPSQIVSLFSFMIIFEGMHIPILYDFLF